MAENTIDRVLQRATARIAPQSDSPRLDAELLLGHVLAYDRAALRARGDAEVGADAFAAFDALVARRASGEPVAYLLGEREFWSLPIGITPGVLIPRPDTETLVQSALEIAASAEGSAADLGTGSGAVALAFAHERPLWTVLATDQDPHALAMARANAARLGIHTLAFAGGDWCEALGDQRFDLIFSNPPYVRADDPHLGRGDLRFEPRHALAAGPDGLDAIRSIAACAPAHLLPGGWLLVEHGYDQADAVTAILHAAGFEDVRHWPDLSGTTRVTGGIAAHRAAPT